jgi:hypothetical protein
MGAGNDGCVVPGLAFLSHTLASEVVMPIMSAKIAMIMQNQNQNDDTFRRLSSRMVPVSVVRKDTGGIEGLSSIYIERIPS